MKETKPRAWSWVGHAAGIAWIVALGYGFEAIERSRQLRAEIRRRLW